MTKHDHPGSPQLRVLLGFPVAIGPGKAALLEAIEKTGSISGAARSMKMSYRRAWNLVDAMNTCFRQPLVDAAPGGRGGGGTSLTDAGRDVLHRYRVMESKASASVEDDVRDLSRLLAASPDTVDNV